MSRRLKLKITFLIALGIFLGSAGLALADLQWVTGGVPKSTTDKSGAGSAVVKDAPSEDTQPAETSDQDVVVGHLITCTHFSNEYPADSVNYFYLNKSTQVCYFAYFLMKPSSRIHTAVVEWFSPAGFKVAKYTREFQVGFTDNLLNLQNETYQWFLVTMTIGMDHMNAEYGQIGLPRDPGLYDIHLTVDGQLVGITFFKVMPADNSIAPIPTVSPASPDQAGRGNTNFNPMPMSTPFSNMPLQRLPKGL